MIWRSISELGVQTSFVVTGEKEALTQQCVLPHPLGGHELCFKMTNSPC